MFYLAGDYLKHVVLKYIEYCQKGDLKSQPGPWTSALPFECAAGSAKSRFHHKMRQVKTYFRSVMGSLNPRFGLLELHSQSHPGH